MRNYSFTIRHLELQIIQFFEELSLQPENEIFSEVSRRNKSNNERILSGVLVSSQKFYDLIKVLLLYHFGKEYREGIKSYLALNVTSKLDRNLEFHWMKILFERSSFFLKWLYHADSISSKSFFGSILSMTEMLNFIDSIIIQFVYEIRKPVKKNQFIRGYRDKGSLKDPSSRARMKADSFPEYDRIIKLIEREIIVQQERTCFERFLVLGDRSLPPELLLKFRLLKKEKILCQKRPELHE